MYYETKIKNNEVIIDGVPWSKWKGEQWQKWMHNTDELLAQCVRIMEKLAYLHKNWNKR